MVASVLFLVAMAGSLLVMRAGGLFIRNEQRHVVHWSVGSELSERYEHLGDVCVQVRELAGDWSVANPELVGAKTAASGIGNLDEGVGQTWDQAQATVNVGNDTDNRRGCHLIFSW